MKTKQTFAYGIFAVLIALAFIACPDPTPVHTHSYSAEWSHNAAQHWHECSCGAKTDVANHSGDPCAICGYASGSQNPDPCECNGNAEDCECDDCDCETCEEEIPPVVHTVTFDADNGSEPATQTVDEGGKAEKPADPAKNGYGFAYWFNTVTDTEWDFTAPITANLSLKAKWNINQYTVTFDADNGSEPTTQTVTEGGTAEKPADPSKAYTPIGLYAGTPPTACTFVEWQKPDGSAWNFTADTVTADITLTAQWTVPTLIDLTEETGNNIVEKAVSYVNANGGSEYTLVLGESVSDVAPQTLDQNDTTLTITSDGNTERKISLGENGSLFTVGGTSSNACSAKLVIDGHITLEGKADNNATLVFVIFGGSLDLKGYTKITGNKRIFSSYSNDGGGGLNAYGSTSNPDVIITMSGNAEISGNSAINTSEDTSFGRGGGVLIRRAIFIMNDDSSIKDNTASSGGGGITVGIQSTLYMNGGEILNNTANIGGGVYIYDFPTGGTFIVASEQVKEYIHNNTAPTNPQVFIGTGGTFTVGGEPADSF